MKKLPVSIFVLAGLSATATQAQQKMGDEANSDMAAKPAAGAQANHVTKGTVKKVDIKAGVVTLAHEPVKSLGWPGMTMGFKVPDKALFDKLTEGAQVEFEFRQIGKDYVIGAVKSPGQYLSRP